MAYKKYNPGNTPKRHHFVVDGKPWYFRFVRNIDYSIIPDDEWPYGKWPAYKMHPAIKESEYLKMIGDEPAPKVKKVSKKKAEPKEETPEEEPTFFFEPEDDDAQTN